MISQRMTCLVRTIVLLQILGWLSGAAAHRGLLTRASCDGDFGSSAAALSIPDPSISWSFKHYLDCSHRAVWQKFTNPRAGFLFYVGVGIPTRDRFKDVRPDALITGPGLPLLSNADVNSLPTEIRNDPVMGQSPRGLIFRSPANQSTCAHLGPTMTRSSTIRNGRCDFYERYGRTNSWRVLDADQNSIPSAGAEYHVAVWLQKHQSAKIGIALGTWVENFRSQYNIARPNCTRAMTDFGEMSASQEKDFPVVDCPATARATTAIAGVGLRPHFNPDNVVQRCSEVSPTCPNGTVYAATNDCTASSGSKYIPHMGCGGERCPAAVKVWDRTNQKMHSGMAINFTGDVRLDFVRGMIPHHTGALDMCNDLLNQLTCADWTDVGALDGMVHFCTHVRREQEWEVGGMNNWLTRNGYPQEVKECPHSAGVHNSSAEHSPMTMATNNNQKEMSHSQHSPATHQTGGHQRRSSGMTMTGMGMGMMMSDGCGNVTAASSKAFIEANHLMHGGMAVDLSCDHAVDFVRMMIPHHAGAIKMCETLTQYDNEQSGADTFLRDLCVNITRTQRAEIAWMSQWLQGRNFSTISSCAEKCRPVNSTGGNTTDSTTSTATTGSHSGMNHHSHATMTASSAVARRRRQAGSTQKLLLQPINPEPAVPCEDLLSTSGYCHWNGELLERNTSDPLFCTCELLLKRPGFTCDTILEGQLNVSAECLRSCGRCGARTTRAPLFYQACPVGLQAVPRQSSAHGNSTTMMTMPGMMGSSFSSISSTSVGSMTSEFSAVSGASGPTQLLMKLAVICIASIL